MEHLIVSSVLLRFVLCCFRPGTAARVLMPFGGFRDFGICKELHDDVTVRMNILARPYRRLRKSAMKGTYTS